MWKSGTFDLEDINEALIEEIVFDGNEDCTTVNTLDTICCVI